MFDNNFNTCKDNYQCDTLEELYFLMCLYVCRLPLPWFLYTVVFMEAVPVRSDGMVCSITLLFAMLILVFLSILLSNWKMTKGEETESAS
jgi:hypothetical protein